MRTNHTKLRLYLIIFLISFFGLLNTVTVQAQNRKYNGRYEGANLNRVAFPIGGIGAGMEIENTEYKIIELEVD